MSRQNYPETSRKSLCTSSAQQIKDLKLQIQLKNHEIEDLKFELENTRKKQSIWYHLDQTCEKANIQQQRKQTSAQNQKLKSQISTMLGQLDHKSQIIREQGEKISDLKQYSIELKKLAQKSQNIHIKQMQFLKSSLDTSNQTTALKKQKQKLEIALSKCETIVKQMQQYYMGQIQTIKQQLSQQRDVIVRLENVKNALQQEINKKQYEIQTLRNRNNSKNNSEVEELSQLIKRQTYEKKWEIALSQVREHYQKQTTQLKDQIRYLLVKIDSLQSPKSNYEGLTTSILTQSKLGLSSSSASAINNNNQSFRFTANNSFSSSIKQSLSRRDTGPLRTPSKSSRSSNNIGYLLDRTNL